MVLSSVIDALNNLKSYIGCDFIVVNIKITNNNLKITYIDPLYGSLREIIYFKNEEI